ARPGGELDLAPRPQRQLGESAHQPARHELAQVIRRRARGVQLVEDHVDLAECPGKAVDGGVRTPGERVAAVVRAGVTVVAVGRCARPTGTRARIAAPDPDADVPAYAGLGRWRRRPEALTVHALVALGARVAVVARPGDVGDVAARERVTHRILAGTARPPHP